jgi:hypothetical protein
MSSSVVVVFVVVALVFVIGNVCLTVAVGLTVVVGFFALRFGDFDVVFLGGGFVVAVVVVPIGDARRMSPSSGSLATKSESSSSSSSPDTRSRSRSNPGSAAYTLALGRPRRATACDVYKGGRGRKLRRGRDISTHCEISLIDVGQGGRIRSHG